MAIVIFADILGNIYALDRYILNDYRIAIFHDSPEKIKG